jgi:hypothetical protein
VAADNTSVMWQVIATLKEPLVSEHNILRSRMVIKGDLSATSLPLILGSLDGMVSITSFSGVLSKGNTSWCLEDQRQLFGRLKPGDEVLLRLSWQFDPTNKKASLELLSGLESCGDETMKATKSEGTVVLNSHCSILISNASGIHQ